MDEPTRPARAAITAATTACACRGDLAFAGMSRPGEAVPGMPDRTRLDRDWPGGTGELDGPDVLGDRIGLARRLARMTPAEFALRLDLPVWQLEAYENGLGGAVPRCLITRVAGALGMPVGWFTSPADLA